MKNSLQGRRGVANYDMLEQTSATAHEGSTHHAASAQRAVLVETATVATCFTLTALSAATSPLRDTTSQQTGPDAAKILGLQARMPRAL